MRFYSSGSQTSFADGTLYLRNIIAGSLFLLSANYIQLSFCYDEYTVVVKTVTLRIVQSQVKCTNTH